jgi:4-diphosphocytidyl-2-C-methyl-D-erythritol kinase
MSMVGHHVVWSDETRKDKVVGFVIAPAKINLDLRVGQREKNGFHPLVSWMIAVGLFDNLEFELSDSPGFSMACNNPSLPTDDSNLVLKAAKAIGTRLAKPPGVHIRLSKQIPSGAGLGGGSADAAATLIALNYLLGAELPIEELSQIASTIGSDVPFFLFGPSSVCQGRGDRVVPLSLASFFHVVLFRNPIHLPTPQVYRKFDELGLGRTTLESPDYGEWTKLGAMDLLEKLENDLEPAAFAVRPELGILRDNLENTIGQRVRMSGSGSCLFTLCDNLRQAEIFCVRAADKCGIFPLVAPVAKAD